MENERIMYEFHTVVSDIIIKDNRRLPYRTESGGIRPYLSFCFASRANLVLAYNLSAERIDQQTLAALLFTAVAQSSSKLYGGIPDELLLFGMILFQKMENGRQKRSNLLFMSGLSLSTIGMVRKSCWCVFLCVRSLMNKTAVAWLHNSIAEKAFLPEAQARQKECLLVPVVMAEFAALFCTGRQPDPYNAGAMERLASAMERLTPCSGKVVFTTTGYNKSVTN